MKGERTMGEKLKDGCGQERETEEESPTPAPAPAQEGTGAAAPTTPPQDGSGGVLEGGKGDE